MAHHFFNLDPLTADGLPQRMGHSGKLDIWYNRHIQSRTAQLNLPSIDIVDATQSPDGITVVLADGRQALFKNWSDPGLWSDGSQLTSQESEAIINALDTYWATGGSSQEDPNFGDPQEDPNFGDPHDPHQAQLKRVLPGLALATGLMMGSPARADGITPPGLPPSGQDPSSWVHKDHQIPDVQPPWYEGENAKNEHRIDQQRQQTQDDLKTRDVQRQLGQGDDTRLVHNGTAKVAHPVWNISATGVLERKVPEMGREADEADKMSDMEMPQAQSMMQQTASMYLGGRELIGKIAKVASNGNIDLQVGNDLYTDINPDFIMVFKP